MSELAHLIKKRGSIKATVTNIKKFMDRMAVDHEAGQAVNKEQLETRVEKLKEAWCEFHEVENQLSQHPNQTLESEDFEDKYFDTMAALKRMLNTRSPSVVLPCLPTNHMSLSRGYDGDRSAYMGVDIRLPRVTIEPFFGDYSKWQSFQDQFTTSIDANESLSNVHKFQYLKGLLKGDAANLIRHLPLTEANYMEAWNKLVKRYDKKKHTVKELIELFLNQASDTSGSVKILRSLCDVSDEVLRGIKALGQQWESREPWLVHILVKKLDIDTQQLWAQHANDIECPTVIQLIEFITNRCDALESCAVTKRSNPTRHNPMAKVLTSTSTGESSECPMCRKRHPLYRCFQFKRLKAGARKKFIYQKQLCEKCMNPNHKMEKCEQNITCYQCGGNHNTLLHVNINETEGITTKNHFTSTNTSTNHSPVDKTMMEVINSHLNVKANHRSSGSSDDTSCRLSRAVLSTMLVNLSDDDGSLHVVRALLDSGSQSSLISESCVRRIGLKRVRASMIVNGLGITRAGHTKGAVQCHISSRHDINARISVKALILPKLTTCLPSVSINRYNWPILDTLNLADPSFHTSGEIDAIFGNDVFLEMLLPEKINIEPHLFAQNTKFGWIIGGICQENDDKITTSCHSAIIDNDHELKLLQKFWEIEEMHTNTKFTDAEEQCENHYRKTTTRDANGRYVVRLPFKGTAAILGDSVYCASKRLISIEKKFAKNQSFGELYKTFMTEYSNLGHMEIIATNELPNNHIYLPHHAIYKETSTTTKLRVVFDGSCKTSSGISLNDTLFVGPTIQEELLAILLRFRTHNIVLSADIEKMYRQVKLHPSDCDYQRILWRNCATNEVQHYRLNTVTYGTTSAPFLAIRTLHQLADDYTNQYPEAAAILKRDYYVDDMLTGCDDIEQAISLFNNISKLLAEGGFHLRKWYSNSKEVMAYIPNELQGSSSLEIEDASSIKTLGLHWNPVRDTFSFRVSLDANVKFSKRALLSEASRIFDPLGWVSPTTILVKLLFQQLWLRSLDWDDHLPNDIQEKWIKLRATLPELENVSIPRQIQPANSTNPQIHIFSDASELAYCAVAYLRTTRGATVTTRIIAAKTRVAPIKQVSLPRLELCGAVLSCRLLKYINRCLQSRSYEIFAWTDSHIVLSWLADHPRRWKCFVANRTAEILETIPTKHWKYVPSLDNPADLGSRGVIASNLIHNTLWWKGPPFLAQDMQHWPKPRISRNPATEFENDKLEVSRKLLQNYHISIKSAHPCLRLFTKYSSLNKIYRILCYTFRFSLIARRVFTEHVKLKNDILPPTVSEMALAERCCIKWVQAEAFSSDLNHLTSYGEINKGSKLVSLTPFIDDNGVMRVGGRISNSSCNFDTKHPIILPQNHIYTKLIIAKYHGQNAHPGPSLLTSILRQKFWIIGCRNMTRWHVKKCIVCFRRNKLHNQQLMADLPRERVSSGRPFLYTGVDYAGPIYIRDRRGRGKCNVTKAYIALFICLSVKAIHVELVSDMTSDAFIAALKRFISRRGIPCQIHCDNGSNFIGARNELHLLYELFKSDSHIKLIYEYLCPQNIVFKFNPPNAPHFGGLWEANIKSVKSHLYKVAGSTSLTYEEAVTVLTQIEALLNSRPLCAVSDDVTSYDVLTPAHFLIGQPFTSIPEPDISHITSSRLSKWQNVQNRVQAFWHSWSRDYLNTMNQRQKWKNKSQNLNINQLVLIKDDNIPQSHWIMGRIQQVHSGKDGQVRVATIKTSRGVTKRPIVKLIPVPIEDDNNTKCTEDSA